MPGRLAARESLLQNAHQALALGLIKRGERNGALAAQLRDKSDAAFPGQLNHGVIRQFRNLHLQHSYLFPGLFYSRPNVATGAFLAVRYRQFCKGIKIRILRQLRSQTVSYQA